MKRRNYWRLLLRALLMVLVGSMLLPGFRPAFASNASHLNNSGHKATTTASTSLALPREFRSQYPSGNQQRESVSKHFPFQTQRSTDGLVIVHYYHGSTTFAQQMITLVQQDLLHPVHDTLGFSLKRPVNIYLYATRADFLAGAPVSNPAETGALTDPITSSVYLVSADPNDDGASDALPHELTHVVFHQNEDVGHLEELVFNYFPLWLDEGLATYDEPMTSAQVSNYQSAMATIVSTHQLVDLLRNFNYDYPADPTIDFHAYSEAHAFIGYLVDTYGLNALHQFLASIRNGEFLLATETVFGADPQILMERWAASIGYTAPGEKLGYAPIFFQPISVQTASTLRKANLDIPFPALWNPGVPNIVLALLVFFLLLALFFWSQAWSYWRRLRPGTILTMPVRDEPQKHTYSGLLDSVASSATSQAAAQTPASVSETPETATDATLMVFSKSLQYRRPTRPYLIEAVLTLLPAPLAAGVGYVWVSMDPLHAWRSGYLVAALVVLPFACAVLWLALRDGIPLRIPLFRVLNLLFVVLLFALLIQQATSIARLQAMQYEQQGAYRLALRYFANAGATTAAQADDLERVHIEWGNSAALGNDYPTALVQLQEAVAFEGTATGQYNEELNALITTLGRDFISAGHYTQAIQVYQTQLHSISCLAPCQSGLQDAIAQTYLTWANALLVSGNFADALSTFQIITTNYNHTTAFATAQRAGPEVGALQLLQAALAAGAHGNYTTMNTQLRQLAARYPQTAAGGIEAAATPEPVSGVIEDAIGAPVAGDRLFFLAFTSAAQARNFLHASQDASAFKVAVTLGSNGTFSVRLQPGYWYLPVWDDPTWASNSYFNYPQSPTGDAFTVHSYTPENVGIILGF